VKFGDRKVFPADRGIPSGWWNRHGEMGGGAEEAASKNKTWLEDRLGKTIQPLNSWRNKAGF
jgi:hypothetical protein